MNSKKCITFRKFKLFVGVLGTLKRLGILEQTDFMVTWEKKPRMVLSKLGDIEFDNPQKVYGATITVWNAYGIPLFRKKFSIVGADEDS